MSTLITDEASFTTSQARPQTDDVNAAKEGLPQIIQSNIPNPLLIFYRGEPEVLGTVQIFLGIVFLSFGIMFSIMCEKPCPYLDNITMSYVLIWSSALYIVSGSVSLATSLKPTIVKVRASLVMTMISIAAASYAILVVIPIFPSALYIPYPDTYVLACAYYNPHTECIGAFNPMVCLGGIVILFFLLTILMFCITISTSVFACRTVCRKSYNEMSVVIYRCTPSNVAGTSTEAPPPSTTLLDA